MESAVLSGAAIVSLGGAFLLPLLHEIRLGRAERRIVGQLAQPADQRGALRVEDRILLGRRDRVVQHSRIRRPDSKDYHGGYDAEGYAAAEAAAER